MLQFQTQSPPETLSWYNQRCNRGISYLEECILITSVFAETNFSKLTIKFCCSFAWLPLISACFGKGGDCLPPCHGGIRNRVRHVSRESSVLRSFQKPPSACWSQRQLLPKPFQLRIQQRAFWRGRARGKHVYACCVQHLSPVLVMYQVSLPRTRWPVLSLHCSHWSWVWKKAEFSVGRKVLKLPAVLIETVWD